MKKNNFNSKKSNSSIKIKLLNSINLDHIYSYHLDHYYNDFPKILTPPLNPPKPIISIPIIPSNNNIIFFEELSFILELLNKKKLII